MKLVTALALFRIAIYAILIHTSVKLVTEQHRKSVIKIVILIHTSVKLVTFEEASPASVDLF